MISSQQVWGQTYSTAQLLEAWRVEGVNQTISAELSYADVTANFNEAVFCKRVEELNAILSHNSHEKRLAARVMLFRLQGRPDDVSIEDLWNCILRTSELGDEQLLSEMYAKYAEIKAPQNEKLYYLLKALQIQEQLGVQYFKHIYFRYLTVGRILYRINDFERSLQFSLRGISFFNPKTSYFLDYIYLLDLAGASYKNLGNADSAFVQYVKIEKLIDDYEREPKQFYGKQVEAKYLSIWKGIAAGGKGRALVLKKKYNEAISLLNVNLDTVLKYGELGNAASVLNVLANIHWHHNNLSSALKLFKKAHNYGLKSNEYYHLNAKLETAEGLTKIFSALRQPDSAYFYLQLFNELKDSVQKKANAIRFSEVKTGLEFELMQKSFDKAEQELNQQKSLRNAILLGIAVIAIIVLLLYNSKRLKYKISKEKLNMEKELAQKDVAYAKEQLKAFTDNISEKNKLIEDLRVHYQSIRPNADFHIDEISILTDEDWNDFKKSFLRVHPNFLTEVKRLMPDVSAAEQRFLVLSKLKVSTKDMAIAQGITQDSVRKQRYRLRRKLESISPNLTLENFLVQN